MSSRNAYLGRRNAPLPGKLNAILKMQHYVCVPGEPAGKPKSGQPFRSAVVGRMSTIVVRRGTNGWPLFGFPQGLAGTHT